MNAIPDPRPVGYHGAVTDFKRRLIEFTLHESSGNRTHAARALGLQRTYLLRLIRDLNVAAPPVQPRRAAAAPAPSPSPAAQHDLRRLPPPPPPATTNRQDGRPPAARAAAGPRGAHQSSVHAPDGPRNGRPAPAPSRLPPASASRR
jgi:hypothetical protein